MFDIGSDDYKYDFKKNNKCRIKTLDGIIVIEFKNPDRCNQKIYVYNEDEINDSILDFIIELFHLLFNTKKKDA